ncbi:MAG: hypothetical protein ACKVQC_08000 [Elusimicrobiota bacterium]
MISNFMNLSIKTWFSIILIKFLIIINGFSVVSADTHHFNINTPTPLCPGLNKIEIESKSATDKLNQSDNQAITVITFIGDTNKTQTIGLISGKQTIELDLKKDLINMIQIMSVNNPLLVAYKDLTPVHCKGEK